MIASIAGCMLAVLPVLYLVYRRRMHPLIAWAILAAGFFGFSQLFPENRNQRGQLAIMMAVGSGVLTWYVVRAMRRDQRKHKQTSDADSINGTT